MPVSLRPPTPKKSALIGQLQQAWAGTTHIVLASGLLVVFATTAMLGARLRLVTVQFSLHSHTEFLTARLKAQFLNMCCVNFYAAWTFSHLQLDLLCNRKQRGHFQNKCWEILISFWWRWNKTDFVLLPYHHQKKSKHPSSDSARSYNTHNAIQ